MFDLNWIRIKNFRSYAGDHTFDFPTEPGVYFLTGANEQEPTLGSNGAGKSSFLDAITWCLYGRTTRGLKASDIISWGQDTCEVELNLSVGETDLAVKRSQKPNALYLNKKLVDQQELEKHLRLNFESFLYAVLTPQFGKSFFSLSPTDKLNLFSELLELNFWLEKSELAGALLKQYAGHIEALNTKITHKNGQLASLESNLISLKEKSDSFNTTRTEDIKVLRRTLSDLEFELDSLSESLQSRHDPIDTAVAATSKKRELKKLFESRDMCLEDIKITSREIASLKKQQNSINEEILELTKLKGHCPTCQQFVDKGYVEVVIEGLRKQLTHTARVITFNEEGLQTFTKLIVKTNMSIQVEERKLELLEASAVQAQQDLLKDQSKFKELQKEEQGLNAKIVALKKEQNPFNELIKDNIAKQQILKDQIKENKDKITAIQVEEASATYWVGGFKRLRLFIVEQAFQTLEVEINNSLTQLGLEDWQITFDVERENKTGGVTKGFMVFVAAPGTDKPVRWESWSGGETQRLELAGTLGLANLIMQQAGLQNKIELFDEPTKHLSGEGRDDLANTLHERAIAEGKKIWIADHSAISNFGAFKDTITVRKSKNGSSITTGG